LYHTSAEVFGLALHVAASVVALAPSNVAAVFVHDGPDVKVTAVAQVAWENEAFLKKNTEIKRTAKALVVAFIKELNFVKCINTTVVI
jgi:hypothetical protein